MAIRTTKALKALAAERQAEGLPLTGKRFVVAHGGNPAKGGAETKANADKRAAELAPIVAELKAEGHTSVRKLAEALEARGVPTERGGPWHVTGVQRLLKRIAALP